PGLCRGRNASGTVDHADGELAGSPCMRCTTGKALKGLRPRSGAKGLTARNRAIPTTRLPRRRSRARVGEAKTMPIIDSLLDIDFYKFTMGHWVFKRYPTIPVRYAFKNRTAQVRLADYIDETELRRELDHLRTLRVNASELHYLRGT